MVLVTADQLQAMRDEIGEVVRKPPRQGNPEAKRIAVYLFAYALDLEKAPQRRGAEHGTADAGGCPPVFLTLSFTRWFPVGLVVGLFTLLPLERGLTVAQALTASAMSGFVVFALELPTSGFADASRPTAGVHRRGGRRSVSRPWPTSWRRRSGCSPWPRASWVSSAPSTPARSRRGSSTPCTPPSRSRRRRRPGGAGDPRRGGIASGALISVVWSGGTFADQSALLLPVAIFVALNVVHLVAVLALLREPRTHVDSTGARRALQSAKEAPRGHPRRAQPAAPQPHPARTVMVEVFWSVAMVVFETFQPIRLAEMLGSEEQAGALMGPVASAGWAVFAVGSALAG